MQLSNTIIHTNKTVPSTVPSIKTTVALPADPRNPVVRSVAKISRAVRAALRKVAVFFETVRLCLRFYYTKHLFLPIASRLGGKPEKLFAQLHGDDFVRNIRSYEGNDARITCYSMIQKWRAYNKKYPDQKEKILPIIKNLEFCLDLYIEQIEITLSKKLTKTEKTKKLHALAKKVLQQAKNLPVGESLLLPVIWLSASGSHFQAVFIQKQKDHSLQKTLIETSGSGRSFNPKHLKEKTKFPRFVRKNVLQNQIKQDTDFYKSIFELPLSILQGASTASSLLREGIWDSSLGTSVVPKESDPTEWTTGQRSGSCTVRPFMQLLFAHLPYKEAKETKRQLLEMDIAEQHKKMLKKPKNRVLLQQAIQHLKQMGDKHEVPENKRKIEKLVQKKLKESRKKDLCNSGKINSIFGNPFPKFENDLAKNWGIKWKSGKNNKYTCTIQNKAYTLSQKQQISFIQGFDQFFVLETSSGKKKAALPKGTFSKNQKKHPLAPHIHFASAPKDVLLLDLDEAGKPKPSTPEECLYLALISLSMKRYQEASSYLKQAFSQKIDPEKTFPLTQQLLNLTHAGSASEAALAAYAAVHHLPQLLEKEATYTQLENVFHAIRAKGKNIHEDIPSYKTLKEQLEKERNALEDTERAITDFLLEQLNQECIGHSQYKQPEDLFGITFKNNTAKIEGNTYRLASKQWLSFVPRFTDFVTLETDAGTLFALLPNPSNTEKPYYLCPLDKERKMKTEVAEENIHLATIAYQRKYWGTAARLLAKCPKDKEIEEGAYKKAKELLDQLKDKTTNPVECQLALHLLYYINQSMHTTEPLYQLHKNLRKAQKEFKPHWIEKLRQEYIKETLGTWEMLFVSLCHAEGKFAESLKTGTNNKNKQTWKKLLEHHRDTFPLTREKINAISLIRPGNSFVLCFLYYYDLLTRSNCSEKDKEWVRRRVEIARSDLSPLNKQLRAILTKVLETPERYQPLSTLANVANLSSFILKEEEETT